MAYIKVAIHSLFGQSLHFRFEEPHRHVVNPAEVKMLHVYIT